MIEIIRVGQLKRVTCPHCASLLQYNATQDPFCDDIRYNEKLRVSVYHWYIKCPQCGGRVKVDEKHSR